MKKKRPIRTLVKEQFCKEKPDGSKEIGFVIVISLLALPNSSTLRYNNKYTYYKHIGTKPDTY